MIGVSDSFYYSCMCVWYVWCMCLTCWHMWLGQHMLVCAQASGSQRVPLRDFLLLPSLYRGKVFQTQSSAIQLVQLALGSPLSLAPENWGCRQAPYPPSFDMSPGESQDPNSSSDPCTLSVTHNATQHNTTQYNTTQHNATQHNAIQCNNKNGLSLCENSYVVCQQGGREPGYWDHVWGY